MNTTKNSNPGTRYAWTGYAAAIACMIALFIYGLIQNNQGMVVMASSVAALSGATWAATSAAKNKKQQAQK